MRYYNISSAFIYTRHRKKAKNRNLQGAYYTLLGSPRAKGRQAALTKYPGIKPSY